MSDDVFGVGRYRHHSDSIGRGAMTSSGGAQQRMQTPQNNY